MGSKRYDNPEDKPLSYQQKLFVSEASKPGVSFQQAAKRAGYKGLTITVQNLPNVAKALRENQQEQVNRVQCDADWVLKRLMLMADGNLADYIQVNGSEIDIAVDGLTRDEMYALAELTTETIPGGGLTQKKKIRLSDRKGALDTIAKHLGMLIERRDITSGGMPLTALTGDLDEDELDRRIAAAEVRKASQALQG